MKTFKELATETINEAYSTYKLNKNVIEIGNSFTKDKAINILLKAGIKDEPLMQQLDKRVENLTFSSDEVAKKCYEILLKSNLEKITSKEAEAYTTELYKDLKELTKKGYKIKHSATNAIGIMSPDGMAIGRLVIDPMYVSF